MTSLLTYDFSTLYTTLSHNLIKEKLNDLTEWSFKKESLLYLACNGRNGFIFLLLNTKLNFGSVKICVTP